MSREMSVSQSELQRLMGQVRALAPCSRNSSTTFAARGWFRSAGRAKWRTPPGRMAGNGEIGAARGG